MNKKILWVVSGSLFAIAIVATIVLTIVFTVPTMGNFESIYNDDSKIISNKNCFLEKSAIKSWNKDIFTTKIGEFTGVKKIKTVECESNQVFKVDLNIRSGEFKLVLVNPQSNEIFVVANNTINDDIEVEIPAGKYDIKMVGLYAKINLTLDFSNLLVVK